MKNTVIFMATAIICNYSLSMNREVNQYEMYLPNSIALENEVGGMLNQLRANRFDQRLQLLLFRALSGFDYRNPAETNRIATVNQRLSACVQRIAQGDGVLQRAAQIRDEIQGALDVESDQSVIAATLRKAIDTVDSYTDGDPNPPNDNCPEFSPVPAVDASAPAGDSGSSASDDPVPPPSNPLPARRPPPPVSPGKRAAAPAAPAPKPDCSTFDGLIAYIKNKISTAVQYKSGNLNGEVAFLFWHDYRSTLIQRLDLIAAIPVITGNEEKNKEKGEALVNLVNEMRDRSKDKQNKFITDIIRKLDSCLECNDLYRFGTPMPGRPSPIQSLKKRRTES
ncbi:MAG: hypothetical protein LBJ96_02490 [Holosporaceae bacterium]|nr:hypothetical protein [Holosporaceae bacterium]